MSVGEVRSSRGRTAVWGVLDQFLSALSNAGMTFVAANVLGAKDFGVYALLFTAVTIAMGAARALTSEVYTVLMSSAKWSVRVQQQSRCLGASVALGGVAALVGIVAGLSLGLPAGAAFGVAAAFVLPQDAQRFILVADGRVRAAFTNDLTWICVQFAGLAVIVLSGWTTISLLALCWGVGAAAAMGVGTYQLKVWPAVSASRGWFRDTRGYSGYYVTEFLTVAGSGYSIVYIVALIVGVSGAGAYRGAQAIFGPVTAMVGGLRMVALPAVVRLRPQGREQVIRAALAFSAVLLVVSVLVTAGIWALRDIIGPLLLGATAAAAIPLIVPMGLGRAFASASRGLAVGFRALGATKSSLSTRAGISAATLIAATLGASLDGALGAAWGFAIASTVGAGAWVIMLSRQKLVISDEQPGK